MSDTDNVERVMTEVSQSMTRFLKTASIAELFVFAVIMGALSGTIQATARYIVNGFGSVPKSRNIRIG